MSWPKSAGRSATKSAVKRSVVAAAMIAPMLASGSSALAGQITSSSSSDSAWLATQLHQTHFSGQAERSFDTLSYARADASSISDGPHVNGLRADSEASRVLPLAERFRGTNPTGASRPWCAIFANMVLKRTGYLGTGSEAARSFAQYGRPASGPAPGVIAVWPHHVGFVVGSAGPGLIRVVSGNHNNRVDESVYATRGVIAFRHPVKS